MNRVKNVCFSILAVVICIASSSHAFRGKSLRTELAKEPEVTGTFTLILYGGRYADDIETLAVLDREGDGYTFEPYAPDFDFRVIKGLHAKEALSSAVKFVSSVHSSFLNAQLSKVLDDKGAVIGYEMRPLYMPLTYGISDVMDIDYVSRGDKVVIYIRLVPSVERMLRDGDGSRSTLR